MPEGVAPNLGLKRCRATPGVSQLQLRVSRYTVQRSGDTPSILGHFWTHPAPEAPRRRHTGLAPSGHFWEVLNGVGVDGVGVIFPFFCAFFPFFYAFPPFFYASFPFFLRIFPLSSLFSASLSNLLQKWGVSLRPRLHRPRAKLLDTFLFSGTQEKMLACRGLRVSPSKSQQRMQPFNCPNCP